MEKQNKMQNLCLTCCLLIYSFSITQEIHEKTVHLVFNNIIQAIGNNNPRPPSLLIEKTKNVPASYHPIKKNIKIERKVLEICYGFGKDSLNALSYILAHELGHHYNNHGFLAQYATLDFSNEFDQKIESLQQRIDDESEADIYAGFFSHIAGYDALSVSDQFLDKIYKEYNLPNDLPNYPTLIERKSIIKENKEDFKILKVIFDNANILMVLGKYDYAKEFFEYILNKGFTSREIYNNLGLCYIYDALSFDEVFFEVSIPFQIDLSSRVKPESTRSLSVREETLNKLNLAVQQFNIALELDPDYKLSKQNIYFSQIAMSHLIDNVSFQFGSDDILLMGGVCQTCVLGHEFVVNNELNKAKRHFKKGASTCSTCSFNVDFKNKQQLNQIESKFIIVNEEKIDTYCLDFIPDDCRFYHKVSTLKMCNKDIPNGKLVQVKRRISGKSSCISVIEFSAGAYVLKNNIKISINDEIHKLLNNYQDLNILNAGVKKYISPINHPIVFLVENKKITKLYHLDELNF